MKGTQEEFANRLRRRALDRWAVGRSVGRPELPDEERLKRRSVRMTDRQWLFFESLGGGEYLRFLLDEIRAELEALASDRNKEK